MSEPLTVLAAGPILPVHFHKNRCEASRTLGTPSSKPNNLKLRLTIVAACV